MILNVNIGQMPIQLDMKANLSHILNMMGQIEEGELLILPEAALSGYDHDLRFLDQIDVNQLQDSLDHLTEQVKMRKVHLIFGSSLRENEKWINAGIYLSPDGNMEVYRKVNLATHERNAFTAGSQLPIFNMETNQGVVRFGIQLCREIRFPEQWKFLSMEGAQFIAYLTNVISVDSLPVWKSHLISRAAENQRFILGSNVADLNQGCPSIVVSPKGDVLEEIISDKVALKRVQIDLSSVSNWYLDQSRTDVVKIKSDITR
ncbi:carbon-nitrogen hydrolase family protein [Pseudalkalibacillus berkeleyi]|uniref:Carbon-nitrogen hydrolase family protein n=1 Tax=Pseudalkalibacillus berkeleyi TaxID=1069813 RepID=A0ABS9H648_9BACL|nr:carbon-nitrogen hydrolase family protein [Pseudalkalibacillus berkeleyi]MCF6139253.1 carbon-nitrogen hydrolase family protein [Pseudalkalibacillus berkeleyi]